MTPTKKYAHGEPDPLAHLVHDEGYKETIIGHALMYVSAHFDDFLDSIARDGKRDELAEVITKQLFDIWVFPLVGQGARRAMAARTGMAVIDLSDSGLDEAMARFMAAHDQEQGLGPEKGS